MLAGAPDWAQLVIVVDQLEELFTTAAVRHRGAFIRLLAGGRIGPAAVEAVPALATALGAEDRDVRASAADALGQIGPAAAEAVPALVAALGNKTLDTCRRLPRALRRIGPAADPALAMALTDENASVRARATEVLQRLNVDPAPGSASV